LRSLKKISLQNEEENPITTEFFRISVIFLRKIFGGQIKKTMEIEKNIVMRL
jgi:hypothetical protein